MVTYRTTLLLIISLFAAVVLQAQTIISGGFVSGTWNAEGSPYLINGDITLDEANMLSIEPGVQVLFEGNYSFEVYGRMTANGTEKDKIRFSLSDTTGFSAGSNGWGGIAFVGIFSEVTENSTLSNCIVEYCEGNGITCLDYPTLTISQTEIHHNNNIGLVLYEFSDIKLEGVNIHHNGNGGIKAEFSNLDMSDFIIEENGGTGISLMGDSYDSFSAQIHDGIIRNNHTVFSGGGVCILMDSNVDMADVEIYGNEASIGGGIFTYFGTLEMASVAVYNNEALFGGGLYSDVESKLSMLFCLFTGNHAMEDGGAIWMTDPDLTIERTTISGNTADGNGGAVFYELYFNEPGQITNSILWGNTPDEIYTETDGPVVTYSDIEDGYAGEGNIDADPFFLNADGGNYQLSWNDYPAVNGSKSPCIDSGNPGDLPDVDGTVADMGAFYFNQDAMTFAAETVSSTFNLFPNPARDAIWVSGEETIRNISIMTLSGQVMHDQAVGGMESRVDVNGLVPGIYIIRVTWDNDEVSIGKLVKQ